MDQKNTILKTPENINEILNFPGLNKYTVVSSTTVGEEPLPVILYVIKKWLGLHIGSESIFLLDDIKILVKKLSGWDQQNFLDCKYNVGEKRYTIASFYLHSYAKLNSLDFKEIPDVALNESSLSYLIRCLLNEKDEKNITAVINAIEFLIEIEADVNREYAGKTLFQLIVESFENKGIDQTSCEKLISLFIQNNLDLDKKNKDEISTEQIITNIFGWDREKIAEIKNSCLPERYETHYTFSSCIVINRNNCKNPKELLDCAERNKVDISNEIYISDGKNNSIPVVEYVIDACLDGKWKVDEANPVIKKIVSEDSYSVKREIVREYSKAVSAKWEAGKLNTDLRDQLLQTFLELKIINSDDPRLGEFIYFSLQGMPEPLQYVLNNIALDLGDVLSTLTYLVRNNTIDKKHIEPTIEILVKAGADISWRRDYGIIECIKEAEKENKPEIIENLKTVATILIKKGADLTAAINNQTILEFMAQILNLPEEEVLKMSPNIQKIEIGKYYNVESFINGLRKLNIKIVDSLFVSKDGKKYEPVVQYVLNACIDGKWPSPCNIGYFIEELKNNGVKDAFQYTLSSYCYLVQKLIEEKHIDYTDLHSTSPIVKLWAELEILMQNYDDINIEQFVDLALKGYTKPLEFFVKNKEYDIGNQIDTIIDKFVKDDTTIDSVNCKETVRILTESAEKNSNLQYCLRAILEKLSNEHIKENNDKYASLKKIAEIVIKAGVDVRAKFDRWDDKSPTILKKSAEMLGVSEEEVYHMLPYIHVEINPNEQKTLQDILEHLKQSKVPIDSKIIVQYKEQDRWTKEVPIVLYAIKQCMNQQHSIDDLSRLFNTIYGGGNKDKAYNVYSVRYEEHNILSYYFDLVDKQIKAENFNEQESVKILEVLQNYIDFNKVFPDGKTYSIHKAIEIAVYYQQPGILQQMLKSGKIKLQGNSLYLPVSALAEDNTEQLLKLMKLLIENGADVNEDAPTNDDDKQISLLILALEKMYRKDIVDTAMISFLLQHGANVNAKYDCDNEEITAFMIATKLEENTAKKVISLLIQYGLNLNTPVDDATIKDICYNIGFTEEEIQELQKKQLKPLPKPVVKKDIKVEDEDIKPKTNSDLPKALSIAAIAAVPTIVWSFLPQRFNIVALLSEHIPNLAAKVVNVAILSVIGAAFACGASFVCDKAQGKEINAKMALIGAGLVLLANAAVEASKIAFAEAWAKAELNIYINIAAGVITLLFDFLLINFAVPEIANRIDAGRD